MKNLQKLSREEMKKVVGGLVGTCYVNCTPVNPSQTYYYKVASCAGLGPQSCKDGYSYSCSFD